MKRNRRAEKKRWRQWRDLFFGRSLEEIETAMEEPWKPKT